VSDAATRLAALSEDKRALVERALLARAKRRDAGIAPRDPSVDPPLSFPQQRLWFFDRLAPGDPTYNACIAFRLRGALDIQALETAFRLVVERHEALRTVFVVTGNGPVQRVLAQWRLTLPVVDLRQVPVTGRDEALLRLMREESRLPYDLERDLMVRPLLVRLDDDDWVLVVMEHHIAFDGWSDSVLCDELSTIYNAVVSGGGPTLPPLPVQYGDFALWQRQKVEQDEQRLSDYWRAALDGSPTLLELPSDSPRPDVATYEGARAPVDIPASVETMLREFCRRQSVTPFMVLLAGFVGLLHRWSGVTDVPVGTPIANRSRVELEPLIGFFSNTIVVRTRVEADSSFESLVRGVRDAALGAFEHQDLPFEKVVEVVAPRRGASYNPIFQVNFRVTSGPPALPQLAGIHAVPLPVDIGFSRFDLAVELQQRDAGGYSGYVEYNLALFSEHTARGLAAALSGFVTDALARPSVPLADLSMASSAASKPPRRRR
jgi:hypothetical protein